MSTRLQRTYTVNGMTCGHCRVAVRESVGRVAGVSHVDVDLDRGEVTVFGESVDDGAVRDAIIDAGYEPQ